MERFDLGSHKFPVSTASADAQRLFDLGINWCFGFNQEEGAACFHKALEYDDTLAMAHWGVAYASGPFYNLPWRHFGEKEAKDITSLCHHHISRARALAHTSTDKEASLITALSARFAKPHPVDGHEYDRWDDNYSDAMRQVNARFPDDQDIMALFIEAMITRTPWQLWNVKTGHPTPGADTIEALELCEHAIALADQNAQTQHLAILHLHIHLTEMSNQPERALKSADILGTLCPDAGHLNHMPGHTYVLCGDYLGARLASEKAIRADDMYVDYAGPFNFYTTARCHDLHLMMYTCMFLGQYEPAIKAAEQMCATLTREVLSVKDHPLMAITMEGYYSMKMHVLVRFGRWQDIVDTPLPPDPKLYCVSTAMHHYAMGVAFAALKNIAAAENQRQLFHDALRKIPTCRLFFNNQASEILGVAEKMLDGELEYHKGNHELAYANLRESVQRDDDLAYSEPWAWMHPPRHALGALLSEQGNFSEAEDVYRTDLGLNTKLQRCSQHLDNVWALHGLTECLRQRGDRHEIDQISAKLKAAIANSDTAITSSCMCRMAT